MRCLLAPARLVVTLALDLALGRAEQLPDIDTSNPLPCPKH